MDIKPEIYKDLIGKDFKYMARGPEEFDCLGLMYEMYKRLDMPMPEQISVIDKRLRQAAFEEGKSMFETVEFPRPGVIVGFRIGGLLNHVGMMLNDLKFIHIQQNKRVCIEKINDLKWGKRVEGFYKFREKRETNE